MLRGVVAMIDALGFKGIWGNDPENPSTSVLETLKRIGEAAQATGTEAKAYLKRDALPATVVRLVKAPDLKVVQLSDTLVVAAGRIRRDRAVWGRHEPELQGFSQKVLEHVVDGYMRYLVCRCVSQILRTAALCDTPLTYRGVVTCGMFAIDDRFLLGPAVDEAASLIEVADGPFVWIAPSADRDEHSFVDSELKPWKTIAVRHDVPLKGGQKLRRWVINPFAFAVDLDERGTIERKLLRVAMKSDKIDVIVKRGNAREFYKVIALQERMAARKAERAKQAQTAAAAAHVGAATGATLPPGEPPRVVDPDPPSPSAAGVETRPPADEPPTDPPRPLNPRV
jgi:hypothetical protein